MGNFLTLIWGLLERYLITPFIWLLWPIKWHVIRPGKRAVRFTFGKPGQDLGPGWRLFTCGQKMKSRQCARCTRDTTEIRTLTEDRIPVSVDAIIVFDITRLGRAVTLVEDIDEFVDAVVNDLIRDSIQSYTLSELVSETGDIQEAIVKYANKDLAEVGMALRACRIRTLTIDDPDLRRYIGSPAVVGALQKTVEKLDDEEITVSDIMALLSGRIVVSPDTEYENPEPVTLVPLT